MKLEQLSVQLRARSSWEAIELGTALVRREAAAIWKPWCLVTVPVLLLLNALGWALDLIGLAGFLMWWLKPVFDRIPLYVISRSVFAATPSTGETVRAQLRWGWRPMLHYLTWRRFSPARSLFLPVDLLEGVQGGRQRERRSVIGASAYGNAAVLTLVCVSFTAALSLAGIAAIALFVPLELLPEAARTTWALVIEQSPPWLFVGLNLLVWLAVSIIEPFFVGAGFGLYLNRRTELELWDVEIVFRTLRRRLAGASTVLLLCMTLLWAGVHSAPACAQETPAEPSSAQPSPEQDEADVPHTAPAKPGAAQDTAPNLAQVFGEPLADDRSFREAATRAYRDPDLDRTQVHKVWERKNAKDPPKPDEKRDLGWLNGVALLIAFLGEWGLWIVAALLVLTLLLTARHWLPWMRVSFARKPKLDTPVRTEPVTAPLPLPADVAGEARRLWAAGQPRDALALIYRAGVVALARRLRTALPPGATEAQCLRASRQLEQAEDRQLFAQLVRTWQYAAYAQRTPPADEFEALLQQLQQRGGWLA